MQNAVAAAGVAAPAPALVEDDPSWIGTPFLAMPRVRGDIAGPAPVFDPYVARRRPGGGQLLLYNGLIDSVAAIHAVPWEAAGLDRMVAGPRLRRSRGLLGGVRRVVVGGRPAPCARPGPDWCGRHVPPEREAVLLWGDVRLGNLVFDADGRVVAVLDWDLAAVGPREMDLGWHFGLEFMMEELFGQRVPGIPLEDDGARAL